MRSTEGLRPKIGKVGSAAVSSVGLEPEFIPESQAAAQSKVDLSEAKLQHSDSKDLAIISLQDNSPVISPEAEPQWQPPVTGLKKGGLGMTGDPLVESGIDDDIGKDKLFSVAKFLLLPAIIVCATLLGGVALPKVAALGIAALIVGIACIRATKDPEWLLAIMLMYIPFAHLHSFSVAPLVNGTNVIIALCLIAGINFASKKRRQAFRALPGFKLICAWFILSSLSIVTLMFTPGALMYLLKNELTQYTAWLSQFGYYLAVYSLIKTRGQAKRAMIYMMVATVLVVLVGLLETFERMDALLLDDQRVGGVFEQPNDYGGYLAYTVVPFVALLLFNLTRIKAWVLAPQVLLTLKVLVATFSRGAYLAFAIAGFMVMWLRGKLFMMGWGVLALITVAVFPQVLPDSVINRLQTTESVGSSKKLDKSSEHRLILWDAAVKMTLESPLTGKGFKAFPYLKSEYTERHVREADDDGFERMIGVSMASIVPCLAVINLFGSRMVSMSYVGYFYALAVIVQVIYTYHINSSRAGRLGRSAAVAQGKGALIGDTSKTSKAITPKIGRSAEEVSQNQSNNPVVDIQRSALKTTNSKVGIAAKQQSNKPKIGLLKR